MYILGIETSCDETALSIVITDDTVAKSDSPNFRVLSNLVISQINVHAPYGGVFPALAKREHTKNLVPLLETALKESDLYIEGIKELDQTVKNSIAEILEREPELATALIDLFSRAKIPAIDVILVTNGPGLEPALWVGVNFARALSILTHANIVPVNHMEGHVTSILVKDDYLNQNEALYPANEFIFPMISLLVSGGHTQLVLVRDWGDYEIIGETIDDAVGEAFDKVARMLGMEYPGGPKVSKAAMKGQANDEVSLPRPMIHSGDLRFSFSGLKTAVRYLIEDLKARHGEDLDNQLIADIALEFEQSVTEVLVAKTTAAIDTYGAQGLIVAGGVSANRRIAAAMQTLADERGIPLYLPEKTLCGDNSLMITVAGFMNWSANNKTTPEEEVVAVGNLRF
ncbi:tRNA (adenosine(37)-N6)-threonylcarbamoyltransferase complex transferase subunit TsaD [Patescibacteria group bacterium]|nr:tRNA (adenosine(37)-N6)-threonylcarbamoyltransferase complex transferase subunit TsaD [Patescibacteria group bacterium]